MRKSVGTFMVVCYCITMIIVLAISQFTSQAVTTLVESSPISDRTVVVIDAGHGGVDGGATSCNGILESQTNLQIALRLRDVMHLLGFETKMIRTTDTSIYTDGSTIAAQKVSDLKNRVKIVNETQNGILISIHQNTFYDSHYQGAQVFYAKDNTSKELAQTMQNGLANMLNLKSNRKAKAASGIYLMENIEKTGILIECGFISNPEEAIKLNSAEYQKKLCSIIGAVLSMHNPNT